jgi:hypothetical protein
MKFLPVRTMIKPYILCLDKRKALWPKLESDIECMFCVKPRKFICGEGEDKSLNYDWVDKGVVAPPVWRFGTGISANRHFRAFCGHKKITMEAKTEGHDGIILFEDDAVIDTKRIKEFILNCLQETVGYDLIYFGWHAFEYCNDKAVGFNLSIEKDYEAGTPMSLLDVDFPVGGFHSVFICKTAFEKLLDMHPYEPLDSMVNRNASEFKRAIVVPKCVFDPEGWSYCDNREVRR